jgi:hypothetical protein
LFTGARFCRFCGAQLAPLLTEDLPTKVMTGGQGAADTGHVGSQTGQAFAAPPVYYPPAHVYPQATPKSRSPLGWILTFAAIGLMGILLFAVLFIARSGRRARVLPPPPPPPPEMPGGIVIGNAPRLFDLDPDATIAIRSFNGDVSIEGWDKPQAEVTVTKRGGSERDQREAAVVFSSDADSLSVTTARGGGGGNGVRVNLVLKVPREFERLALRINNGRISLSNFGAGIEATLDNGSIVADDISGSVTMKVSNGNTTVRFKDLSDDAPLKFETGRGNVELRFDSLDNADLDAQTGMGNITVAPDFGIRPERHMFTQRAHGTIGEGGRPVKINVGMGNIDIAK